MESGDGTFVELVESGSGLVQGGARVVMAHGWVTGLETLVEGFVADEHAGVDGRGDGVFGADDFPAGNGHLLDEFVFGAADGLEFGAVFEVEVVEVLLGLFGEHGLGGVEPVFCCILTGAGAAFRGASPRRVRPIPAARFFLGFGTLSFFHKQTSLSGFIMEWRCGMGNGLSG